MIRAFKREIITNLLQKAGMIYNYRKVFLLVQLLFISQGVYAQQFGGNPPSLKWKQVNTPSARIIFPQHLDSTAARISNIISYLNTSTQNTIGTKQKKINIVLPVVFYWGWQISHCYFL